MLSFVKGTHSPCRSQTKQDNRRQRKERIGYTRGRSGLPECGRDVECYRAHWLTNQHKSLSLHAACGRQCPSFTHGPLSHSPVSIPLPCIHHTALSASHPKCEARPPSNDSPAPACCSFSSRFLRRTAPPRMRWPHSPNSKVTKPADPISTVPYRLIVATAMNGGGGAFGGEGALATRRSERVTVLLQLRKTTPSALVMVVALLAAACRSSMKRFSSASSPVVNETVIVVSVAVVDVPLFSRGHAEICRGPLV